MPGLYRRGRPCGVGSPAVIFTISFFLSFFHVKAHTERLYIRCTSECFDIPDGRFPLLGPAGLGFPRPVGDAVIGTLEDPVPVSSPSSSLLEYCRDCGTVLYPRSGLGGIVVVCAGRGGLTYTARLYIA